MEARRVIRAFYIFQTTFTFLIWMPIFYDYQRQMGLGDTQIFDIQSYYYLSFCLMELPTGFVADRFGHRLCMQVGSAMQIVCNLIPVFWVTYAGFLSHWLLLALCRSLISGASSAYLYNYLEDLGRVELYKDAEGRARAYSLVAKVVGFAAVGPLMKLGVSMPYTLSAMASAIAMSVALRLPARLSAASVTEAPPKPRASLVLAMVARRPVLALLMLQGIGIFVLTRIIQVNLFQPILQSKGYDATGFGLILALNTVFEAIGAAFPDALGRLMGDIAAVFWLTLGLAGCTYATAGSSAHGSVFFLTLFALLAGLAYPIQRKVLNEAIPDSSYRASLLSVESLLDRFVCAIVAREVGVFSANHEIDRFLVLSAAVCALVNLVVAAALPFRRAD